MIFRCGENWKTREARLEHWHPFFALWPRVVAVEDGKDVCAWLEWIERKGVWHGCGSDYDSSSWWDFEYRRKP